MGFGLLWHYMYDRNRHGKQTHDKSLKIKIHDEKIKDIDNWKFDVRIDDPKYRKYLVIINRDDHTNLQGFQKKIQQIKNGYYACFLLGCIICFFLMLFWKNPFPTHGVPGLLTTNYINILNRTETIIWNEYELRRFVLDALPYYLQYEYGLYKKQFDVGLFPLYELKEPSNANINTPHVSIRSDFLFQTMYKA